MQPADGLSRCSGPNVAKGGPVIENVGLSRHIASTWILVARRQGDKLAAA